MQVLDHYTGEVRGDATIYYYKSADNTSSATRIYSGAAVSIYNNAGAPKQATSKQGTLMYNIYSPGRGWMNTWNVTNVQPVYVTQTDVLAAPQVSLSRANELLTISGGANGDGNTFSGYQVQYRERLLVGGTYPDTWTDDGVIAATAADASKTKAVTVSAITMERQYRVRCQGSAGSDYYSAWTVCASTMYIESADIGAVVISAPLDGSFAHVGRQGVLVVLNREASLNATGNAVQLQYRYGEESWADATGGALSADEGYSAHRIPRKTDEGDYTLHLRLRDSVDQSAVGTEASITFHQHKYNLYTRSISTGSVISSTSISHKGELEQLLGYANIIRAGVNLSEAAFSDLCGKWENWRLNLNQLRSLLVEARTAYNAPAGTFTVDWPTGMTEAPAYPTASVINMVRDMINEF